jgi:hypothetical protein
MTRRLRPLILSCWAVLFFAATAHAQPEGVPCTPEPTDQLLTYGAHIYPCQIGILGDSDLFRFNGSVGEHIVVRVVDQAGGSNSPSCFLDLLRPAGSVVTSTGGNTTCEIRTTLDTTGLFTARVAEVNNDQLMTYAVQLDRLTPVAPSSLSINPGFTLAGGRIDPVGDVDLYVFNGVSGDTISLRMTDQAGGSNTPSCFLDLYAPDGTVTSIGNNTTCLIDATLTQTGVFTARAREVADDSPMTYNLEYQCLIGACPSFHPLSVTRVGSGVVTSAPAGINCGADCFERYFQGTVVTLVPTPDLGASFGGWTGDPDCSDGIVTMSAARSCVATFSISALKPTSLNDVFGTAQNTTLIVAAPGVLSNDTSNGGGPMTASIVTPASSGAAALVIDGGLTYTPNAGFVGVDSFTYQASNANGAGNVATVTLNVLSPTTPQAPTNLVVDSVVGQLVTLRFTAPTLGPAPTGFVLKGGLLPGQVLAALATGHTAPIFTFAAPNGSFFIRIHTLTAAGESGPSNEVPLHVGVAVTPSTPQQLTGLVNGSGLALAWKNTFAGGPPTNVILDVTGSQSVSVPLGPVENFTFAGVPTGTYTFRVRAANAAGSSAPSNPVTLQFPGACLGPPLLPEKFLAYKIGSTVFVRWDPPLSGPAPTEYVLQVSGSFSGSLITTGRSLSGVAGPGTYGLSVRAVNACGSSALTPQQDVTIP